MEVNTIKQSMAEMSQMIHKRLLEFQKDLDRTTTTDALASPPSRLASDFNAFRSFVTTALQCLQAQVDGLYKLCDSQEMRSRRKIILLHGVPEADNEDVVDVSLEIFSSKLKVPNITADGISRCHRLGSHRENKPRPILIKLCDLSKKERIWNSKTGLRGTGITLSEFLTKHRHNIFMSSRSRFGVSKCWTNGGRIFVIGADGVRHTVETMEDLNSIPVDSSSKAQGTTAPTKVTKAIPRTKRIVRADRAK